MLHYAKALKDDFNVVAIAVSGQNETELLVSHFYWKKDTEDYVEFPDKKLLKIEDYLQVFDDQFFISDFYTRDIALKARELKEEFHYTYIFISHDLSVVHFLSDRILVMRDGTLVELADSDAVFRQPKDVYTKQLIDAIPTIG